MEELMVSILCATYNHEDYIRDALEGFLAQKVDFKYEVIVHDDASTDETARIVRQYEDRYPDIIRGIYQKENQYNKKRSILRKVFNICKGKYIATCEGDDFWIDRYKLQMQIDYMEQHKECVLTAHNSIELDYKNRKIKALYPYEKDGKLSSENIIMQYGGNLPSASIVCRAEFIKMEEFFYEAGILDYPLQLNYLTKGTIYYFDRIMSVYRHYHNGSWGKEQISDRKKRLMHSIKMIHFLSQYNWYTDKIYEKYIISRRQGYLSYALNLYKDKTKEDFFTICDEVKKEMDIPYHSYFMKIKKAYVQINDENYCDQIIYDFVKKYSNIVIMGAGNYAGILARQFEHCGITFQGFVVSSNQVVKNNYMDKPVWNICDLPFNLKDTGIVIGINPSIYNQIIEALEEAEVENYICPFLMEIS